jgi:hypothetical protein
MTALPQALIGAYRAAHYTVQADVPLSLRVDEYSEGLAALLALHSVRSAAYVTAFNPCGVQMPPALNEAADARLDTHLTTAGWQHLRASGDDPKGEWPEEPGWLVLGVTPEQADTLGRAYAQNAVLYAGEDAVVRLRLLR